MVATVQGHRLTRDGAVFLPTNQPSGILSGYIPERVPFLAAQEPGANPALSCDLWRGEAFEVLGEHVKLQVNALTAFAGGKGGH